MAEAAPSTRVWIGNLPVDYSREDLSKVFAECGEISRVEKRTSRRFGWVTFADASGVDAALAKNGVVLNDEDGGIKVDAANDPAPRKRNRKRGKKANGGSGAAADGEPEFETVEVPGNPRRVRVGNLTEGVTEDSVKAVFADAGAIQRVKVISRNPENVHAFVTFESADPVEAALAKDGTEVGGVAIAVTPDPNRTRRVRKRGGRAAAPAAGAEGGAKEKKKREKKPSTRIRVTGFPEGTSEEAVSGLFADIGGVTGTETLDDGAIVVSFEEADQATEARQKEGLQIDGTDVKIGFFIPGLNRRRGGRPQRRAAE